MAGSFLDMQARVGITVHLGGLPATRALLDLCHVQPAQEVLEVGCGVGTGLVHAAGTRGCRMVGVDVSAQMIEWSRRRTRQAGVADRVELRVADVLALPFPEDRFDATICESVLAFVPDKARAIAEMVRVTRPGGYVGVSEMYLLAETPSPRVVALARLQATEIVTLDAWRTLWDTSGLENRIVRTHRIDVAREIRSRLRWVGPRGLLGGLARITCLYVTEPSLRPALRLNVGAFPGVEGAGSEGPSPYEAFGYGLFVGRKPPPPPAA